MLHITGESRRERLQEAVKTLKLRFPVADITVKTGFAKSTVSRNLNAEEPSKDFIKTFSKVYGLSFSNMWDGDIDIVIDIDGFQPQGSIAMDTKIKSGLEEPEPDYKAKYFALKAVVVELLRGTVSSNDVLEKLAEDPASPGPTPEAFDDSAPGIERTYKGKKEN